jgi:AraC family transcriptional regulator
MAGLKAQRATTPAGGGPFALEQATLGIFLVDQPTHRLGLGSDRRDARPLKARDGWILPAGSDGICRYDAPHEFLTVSIPDTLFAEMGGDAGFAPRVGALSPLVVEMALDAPRFATQGRLFRQTMERALVAQIVQTVQPVRADVTALDDPRLDRVLDYIHDHLADDIALDDMAALAAMSPFHFARTFRKAKGISPLQYVIATRIDRARSLLQTSRLPVAEIAHQVGYGDVSRFGAHFKRQTGTTPAAFRLG